MNLNIYDMPLTGRMISEYREFLLSCGLRDEEDADIAAIMRDDDGRLVSERYLDRFYNLTNNADGVAGWNGHYSSSGELVIDNRYDQDRNSLM